MTCLKLHDVIGAITARQSDAIICAMTRMKRRATIRAIVTRKRRVRICAMPQMRKIRRIFGESETCVYNRNSFSFVYVRFRSIGGATYQGNRREKK